MSFLPTVLTGNNPRHQSIIKNLAESAGKTGWNAEIEKASEEIRSLSSQEQLEFVFTVVSVP